MLSFPAICADTIIMKRYIPMIMSALLLISLGLYILLSPPESIVSVVVAAFGLYLAFDGFRTLLMRHRIGESIGSSLSGMLLGKGLADAVVGLVILLVALAFPGAILRFLVYIAAAAFLLTGIADLVDLIWLSRLDIPSGSVGLETVLSFVFALILFIFPNILPTVLLTIVAAVLFASGVVMIYGAISSACYARRLRKELEKRLES